MAQPRVKLNFNNWSDPSLRRFCESDRFPFDATPLGRRNAILHLAAGEQRRIQDEFERLKQKRILSPGRVDYISELKEWSANMKWYNKIKRVAEKEYFETLGHALDQEDLGIDKQFEALTIEYENILEREKEISAAKEKSAKKAQSDLSVSESEEDMSVLDADKQTPKGLKRKNPETNLNEHGSKKIASTPGGGNAKSLHPNKALLGGHRHVQAGNEHVVAGMKNREGSSTTRNNPNDKAVEGSTEANRRPLNSRAPTNTPTGPAGMRNNFRDRFQNLQNANESRGEPSNSNKKKKSAGNKFGTSTNIENAKASNEAPKRQPDRAASPSQPMNNASHSGNNQPEALVEPPKQGLSDSQPKIKSGPDQEMLKNKVYIFLAARNWEVGKDRKAALEERLRDGYGISSIDIYDDGAYIFFKQDNDLTYHLRACVDRLEYWNGRKASHATAWVRGIVLEERPSIRDYFDGVR